MGIALAVAILLPFRHTLSVDGAALVLVIPVVQVVAIGGFWAIPFGVVAGFLAYDFFFQKGFNDVKRRGVTVMTPTEFRVDIVRAQLRSYQLRTDEGKSGPPTK